MPTSRRAASAASPPEPAAPARAPRRPPGPSAPSPPTAAFVPFAEDGAVLGVGALALESRVDRVAIAGDVEITRDRRGRVLAGALRDALDAVVAALDADERAGRLPERVAAPRRAAAQRNPFEPPAAAPGPASGPARRRGR